MVDNSLEFGHCAPRHTDYSVHRRVLGLGGSPRRGGNSDILLEHIAGGLKRQGVEADNRHLRDYWFQSCKGCEKCRKDKICTGLNDGMTLLYPLVLRSRGLVLVSPTHTYNVTALMKAFIDRLYCFYDFGDSRPRPWSSRLAGQGRKAVIAAICEQETKESIGVTLEAMRLPLRSMGYDIIREIEVYGLFDRGMIRGRPEVLDRALEAGLELGEAVRL